MTRSLTGGPTLELTSSNLSLRGGKGQLYEGGIRVPFMVQWKGKLPAGKVYCKSLIYLDLYATAASIVNAPFPKNRCIDGVDLMSYLNGESSGRPYEELFWRLNQKTAIRLGDWKLLRNPQRGQSGDWELYNLKQDVSESNDLVKEDVGKFAELQAARDRLDKAMIDPIWQPTR